MAANWEQLFSLLLQGVHENKKRSCHVLDVVKLSSVNKSFRVFFFEHFLFAWVVLQCLCVKFRNGGSRLLIKTLKNEEYDMTLDNCSLWVFGLNNILSNRMVALACQSMWRRRCVQMTIECTGMDFELCDFFHMYKSSIGFNLARAHELCVNLLKRKGVMVPKYVFTFHLVFQNELSSSKIQKKEQRRFICFENVYGAVNFYLNWCKVQRQCIARNMNEKITTLYECGFTTMDPGDQDGVERKWIFDIDAPFEKLYSRKMIGSPDCAQVCEIKVLNGYVVSFGQHLSDYMRRNNLVCCLPHFCILTRHTNKKLSWHLTCNVMGKMKHWSVLLHHFDQELEKDQSVDFYKIVSFVDKCTRNNKKGQYMQTLMSMKTGGLHEGLFPFEYFGLFRGDGCQEIFLEKCCEEDIKFFWQYVTCSMMIVDPWCQRMNVYLLDMVCSKVDMLQGIRKRVLTEEKEVQCPTKKIACEAVHSMTSVLSKHKTEDELSSFNCIACVKTKEWVKGFIVSGNSRTSFLPSMRESRNICSVVMGLKRENKCKVLVHSYVSGCGVCPRIFKVMGKDYQHGSNNNCVIICIKMSEEGNLHRAFAYCMSAKCKQIVNARYGPGWIEYTKEDYVKLKLERGKS
jgi:hypothetical protein